MLEENRFFRFVWRVNAVLLALAGLLVIVGVSNNFIETWIRETRYQPRPEGHFTPVPRGEEQNYTYRLQPRPSGPAPAHEQIYALERWNGSPHSYGLAEVRLAANSSGSRFDDDSVNLLAIDTATGASHWLFAGYSRAVIDQLALYADGPHTEIERDTADPIALVLCTVDKDTNGDGQLDGRDRQSLYFYRSGDARAVKFFEADYILSTQETENKDFFVVYEKGTSAVAATFSVPGFKLKSQQQLPSVPQ